MRAVCHTHTLSHTHPKRIFYYFIEFTRQVASQISETHSFLNIWAIYFIRDAMEMC